MAEMALASPKVTTGLGTMIFSGGSSNTYTGLTTVTAGELDLNKTSATAIAGNVLVNGGTLRWVTSALRLIQNGYFEVDPNDKR